MVFSRLGIESALLGMPVLVLASRAVKARRSAAVAMLQDSIPLILVLAWVALVVSVERGTWWVSTAAALMCTYHLFLFARDARPAARPRWVGAAPKLTVASANVYVDNHEPESAVRQLMDSDADVLVVVETTPAFREVFDACGGAERYPFRVYDEHDGSEYAASLYSRVRPVEMSMADIGELRAATATIPVGRARIRLVGAIPHSAIDRGGYTKWRRQVRALGHYAASFDGPLAIVGDLNATTHRVGFRVLTRAGLRSAHALLGQGWRPSFRLAARGPLARLGSLIRLDHALCNRHAWPIWVRDLEHAGSDHRPFVTAIAARPARLTVTSVPRTS